MLTLSESAARLVAVNQTASNALVLTHPKEPRTDGKAALVNQGMGSGKLVTRRGGIARQMDGMKHQDATSVIVTKTCSLARCKNAQQAVQELLVNCVSRQVERLVLIH